MDAPKKEMEETASLLAAYASGADGLLLHRLELNYQRPSISLQAVVDDAKMGKR